jgi:DNA-binding FadR family transcriptional regulator
LGVSETDLKAALGLPDNLPPRPDLAAAATQLGVSETDLREALRPSMERGRGDLQNN